MITDRNRMTRVLRARGFRRDRLSDRDCAAYVLREGDVEYEVQLWYDGWHRASHSLRGRSATKPTEFRTLDGLRHALNRRRALVALGRA